MTAEGVDIASLPAVLFPKRMKLPEVPAIYFAVDGDNPPTFAPEIERDQRNAPRPQHPLEVG